MKRAQRHHDQVHHQEDGDSIDRDHQPANGPAGNQVCDTGPTFNSCGRVRDKTMEQDSENSREAASAVRGLYSNQACRNAAGHTYTIGDERRSAIERTDNK
jgi:hypothetical protein